VTESSVVLITGASGAIGSATARHLAQRGVRLALLGRNEDALRETLAAVEQAGGSGGTFVADITDGAAIERARDAIETTLGPVDVLINNAGAPGPLAALWEVDSSEWRETVDVNLHGTFVCTRAVLPGMVNRRRGRIVNIVSHAGVHRWPYMSAYAVSKAAAIKLTENLAFETRDAGIAVIAAHPGLVRAGFTDAAMTQGMGASGPLEEKMIAWFERELAAGRTVSADEAAEFIVEVATGRADALSGRYVAVDDDLDALVDRADEVRRANLHALKVERLD
jgi:NAD(P)-dependent dehydrogenase (short-subunit alcohol dehydrogenase family)